MQETIKFPLGCLYREQTAINSLIQCSKFKWPLNNINCKQLNKQNPNIMTSDIERKENLFKGP